MLQHLDGELIALIQFARSIHDQQDKIAAFQRLAHFDHHLAAERTVRLVYARSIDQNDLRGVAAFALGQIDDALNSIARGLRFGRDDGEFFAHESIEQRGLAGVRAAENADKTGAERHRSGLRASSRLLARLRLSSSLQYFTKAEAHSDYQAVALST